MDLYERNLINCTSLGTPYKLKLPNFSDLKIPFLEDFMIQILEDPDFEEKTKNEFQIIFNDDICKEDKNNEIMNNCHNFWSGILSKGMRQTVAYLNNIISSVFDELKYLNDDNNKTLFYLINEHSTFFEYEVFSEYYMSKVFQKVQYIFITLRNEKLNSIYKTQLYILLIYILVLLLLFALLMYFLNQYRNIFVSFISFIGIVPIRYLSEDKNLCEAILKFNNNFY